LAEAYKLLSFYLFKKIFIYLGTLAVFALGKGKALVVHSLSEAVRKELEEF